MEAVTSVTQRCSAPLILSFCKHRRCLMAASLSLQFTLSSNCRQLAYAACQFCYHCVLRLSVHILQRLLNPPYLIVLLNLVIMTIAVTSGVLNLSKGGDGEKSSIEHGKSFAVQDDRERSDASSVLNLRMHDFTECRVEKRHSFSKLAFANFEEARLGVVFQNTITSQEIVPYSADKEKMPHSFHHTPVDDTGLKKDIQLIQTGASNDSYSDMQLLRIEDFEGECEMGAEEINARCDAFIRNFYQQLRQQQQF